MKKGKCCCEFDYSEIYSYIDLMFNNLVFLQSTSIIVKFKIYHKYVTHIAEKQWAFFLADDLVTHGHCEKNIQEQIRTQIIL